MYTYIYIYLNIYLSIYLSIYLYLSIYIYIYIYIPHLGAIKHVTLYGSALSVPQVLHTHSPHLPASSTLNLSTLNPTP